MMNIIINNEKISFKLESEKNLGDVMTSLQNWVSKNGNSITSVHVDDELLPLEVETSRFQRDISSIKEIKIFTSSQVELAIDAIKSIGDYIVRVLERINLVKKGDNNDEILEGMELVHEGITDCLKLLKIKPVTVMGEGKNLKDILQEMKSFLSHYERRYIDERGFENLKLLFNNLLRLIPKILRWAMLKNDLISDKLEKELVLSYQKEIIHDVHFLCKEYLDEFEKIGEDLQVGNDWEAFNNISYLTELMDELIVLFQIFKNMKDVNFKNITVSQRNIEELFCEANKQLQEIEKAFINHDMITMGDVIEYELKPLFSDMVLLIEKITVFIH